MLLFKVWYTNSALDGGDKLTSFEYISMSITKIMNGTDPGPNKFLIRKAMEKNADLLVSAVTRYSRIHQQLFGKYEGELMLRPDDQTLHRISGTFKHFLDDFDLMILLPLFELLHTAQGYGYVDEIGALYGLMWNTPEYVISGAL